MTLTEGELYQAIQEAMSKAEAESLEGAPGATLVEIARRMGVSMYKARMLVREAIGAGELMAERGVRLSILGEKTRTPVYRPVQAVNE